MKTPVCPHCGKPLRLLSNGSRMYSISGVEIGENGIPVIKKGRILNEDVENFFICLNENGKCFNTIYELAQLNPSTGKIDAFDDESAYH